MSPDKLTQHVAFELPKPKLDRTDYYQTVYLTEDPHLNMGRHLELTKKEAAARIPKLLEFLEGLQNKGENTFSLTEAAGYIGCAELKIITYLNGLIPKFVIGKKPNTQPAVSFEVRAGQNIITVNDFNAVHSHLNTLSENLPEKKILSTKLKAVIVAARTLLELGKPVTVAMLSTAVRPRTNTWTATEALVYLVEQGEAVQLEKKSHESQDQFLANK